ncbi:MAG: hypothetical protein QM803_18955 [Rhodocyclaceae bacterium]
MEFNDYIEAGVATTGSKAALSRALGVHAPTLHAAIKGKVPLTPEALRKLALLLNDGTTPGQIWEAQQAARAATEEERQLWLPFVKHAHGMAKAASLLMTTGLSALAAVILFLTPAQNAQAKSVGYSVPTHEINIMRSHKDWPHEPCIATNWRYAYTHSPLSAIQLPHILTRRHRSAPAGDAFD